MIKFNSKKITRAGIIGALYVVLTLAVFPVSSGNIQIRISEALTVLPLFFFESIPALFIGCIISNLITGCAVLDIIFGSLVTLLSSVLTFIVGKMIKKPILKFIVGGLFPVLLNALFIPLIWYVFYGKNEYVYIIQCLIIFIGEFISVYILGGALYFSLIKLREKNKI